MSIDWNTVERLFSTLGVPVAILILLALAIWKVSKYLGVRLFDESTGLVTRAVNTHVQFVNKVEEAVHEQKTQAQRQTQVIEELRDVISEVRAAAP